MTDAETSLLTTLTPAIFALVGVLIGSGIHFVGLLFDRKWKREQKLADRYEQLADRLSSTLLWFQKAGESRSFEELSSLSISLDARKLVSLTLLYFEEIEDTAINYSNCLVSYHHLLVDSYDRASLKTAAAQAIEKNEKAYFECADKLFELRNDMDDLIKKHSKKYAKV
jgi:hypothetical protein